MHKSNLKSKQLNEYKKAAEKIRYLLIVLAG